MIRFLIFLFTIFSLCGCDIYKKRIIIIEGTNDIIETLDPAKASEVSEPRIISSIYESLFELDSDYITLHSRLVKNWTVSKDLKSFRLQLKSGIRFHDGSPLQAEAVVYSFQRQITLNPESPLFSMIDEIQPLDSLQLEIRLKHPYAQFLYTLTSPVGLKVISKNALEKYGEEIGNHPVGSGPFQIKEFIRNKKICLVANPYYQEQNSSVQKVHIKFYSSYFEMEQDFLQQQIDLIYAVPGFSIDRLKWQGKVDYSILPPLNVLFLGFNCQQKPFSDGRVRRAILKAIDIPELVNIIYRGKALPAEGPVPPILFPNKNMRQSGFDLIEAKKLLREAGYPDGFSVKFFYLDRLRPRGTLLEALKVYLQKLQIELKMVPFYSWADFNAACRSDSAQLFWNSWDADVLGDPENFLYSLFNSSSAFNFFHYNNSQVDSWLEHAQQEPDREKRQAFYEKIIQQVLEDTPAVFVFHVIPVVAFNRQKIIELPLNPYGIVNYHQIVVN